MLIEPCPCSKEDRKELYGKQKKFHDGMSGI